ncbi:hypothetical protein ElyMa_005582000 [Elysia marginata]|uniref:Uncharacterized protein n=1 Tax=Elysia marginata TaxID=1093978 RepID=A0AAV4F393_9GAST|nr:hypothetical protein ElyMa_005582000 [Elysia marginata]
MYLLMRLLPPEAVVALSEKGLATKTFYTTHYRPCASTTITYDVINSLGSEGFTADDWLTDPASPTAILSSRRYGLRPPERARSA